MGAISPTPSRRALLGAFAVTSAAIATTPTTAEALRREFEAWNDEPITLRRTEEGRRESEFRYHNAERFFRSIEEGLIHDCFDLLYQTGIVLQLGISAHLLDIGFNDDWCRCHIGLRIAKSLAYANVTGFDYRDPHTDLLAAILTPYGRWRHPTLSDRYEEVPFTGADMRRLTRALLDHVHRVSGHPRPKWWRRQL